MISGILFLAMAQGLYMYREHKDNYKLTDKLLVTRTFLTVAIVIVTVRFFNLP